MNGPLNNEYFYVIFYTFLIGVIARTKYNKGLQVHKIRQEVLPRIHWRELESLFSSEHADRMEILKELEDSPEQLHDTWKSQYSEDVLIQRISVCISHDFIPLVFTSANLFLIVKNL